jgi:hypothetical protein
MLLFKRPRQPRGFVKDVTPARRMVARAVAAGNSLDTVPELWRDERYKEAFIAAQHGKCGYCETFALNHAPPMEHHAPKGEVQTLVAEGLEGTKARGLSYRVVGRSTPTISTTGYHWLIYAWTNWLLACERCNTGWKRSLFPVQEAPHPCPPRPGRKVTPLLLSPFGPADPTEHLEFSERGEITPRGDSVRGRETIRTCGLHRESLRKVRSGIAGDTCREVRWLRDALLEGDHRDAWKSTQRLLSLGGAERPHAGMVRSLVLSQLSLRWRDLELLAARLSKLAPSAPRPR